MSLSRSLFMQRLLIVAVVATLVVLGGVLYYFPPTEYSFYPRCWFHDSTGLYCPGCGATRCVYCPDPRRRGPGGGVQRPAAAVPAVPDGERVQRLLARRCRSTSVSWAPAVVDDPGHRHSAYGVLGGAQSAVRAVHVPGAAPALRGSHFRSQPQASAKKRFQNLVAWRASRVSGGSCRYVLPPLTREVCSGKLEPTIDVLL